MRLKEQFSYFKRIRLKVFMRIFWKHGILLKIDSATDAVIIICRKFFKQIFLRKAPEVLMVDLWLKIQMEIVDWNDSIFTCFPFIHIFVWILRAVMYQSAEVRPTPSQASKINLFARIVKVFKLTLLTIFVKSIVTDVWRILITPLTCSNASN